MDPLDLALSVEVARRRPFDITEEELRSYARATLLDDPRNQVEIRAAMADGWLTLQRARAGLSRLYPQRSAIRRPAGLRRGIGC